jgi:phage tail-like protein
MPDLDPNDALGAYRFQIEIDGVTIAQFKEVSGLSVEIKVIEHEEVTPGGKPVVKKIPGPLKWGDITLKRGKTGDQQWWEWINSVHAGNIVEARRNGSIVLYDYAYGEKARYNFINGWPSKVNISGLKAGGSEVVVEECTLVHEGLEFA